jgi:hypothetical protein
MTMKWFLTREGALWTARTWVGCHVAALVMASAISTVLATFV